MEWNALSHRQKGFKAIHFLTTATGRGSCGGSVDWVDYITYEAKKRPLLHHFIIR